MVEELLRSQRSNETETKEVCNTPSVQEASFEMEDGIVIKSNKHLDSYDHAVKALDQNNVVCDSKIIKNADEFLKNIFLKKKQKIPLTLAERTIGSKPQGTVHSSEEGNVKKVQRRFE